MFVFLVLVISKTHSMEEPYLACELIKYIIKELKNVGLTEEQISSLMYSQCSKLSSRYNDTCIKFIFHHIKSDDNCRSLLSSQSSILLGFSASKELCEICFDSLSFVKIIITEVLQEVSTIYSNSDTIKLAFKIFKSVSPFITKICKVFPNCNEQSILNS